MQIHLWLKFKKYKAMSVSEATLARSPKYVCNTELDVGEKLNINQLDFQNDTMCYAVTQVHWHPQNYHNQSVRRCRLNLVHNYFITIFTLISERIRLFNALLFYARSCFSSFIIMQLLCNFSFRNSFTWNCIAQLDDTQVVWILSPMHAKIKYPTSIRPLGRQRKRILKICFCIAQRLFFQEITSLGDALTQPTGYIVTDCNQ